VLEDCQLLDLVDDPQPIGSADQEVGRVLDRSARAGQAAQLVDELGRRI
jgi:hypothetical protein